MLKNRPFASLAFVGLFALASTASAQSFPRGGGTLAGADRLGVPGCGRGGGLISAAVAAEPYAYASIMPGPGGDWTATVGTTAYSGSGNAINDRLARLALDAASLAALRAALETGASTLCGEAVTISSLNANAALKLNKRQTHAWLGLRARGMGTTASGGEGNGRYALRARGPWLTPQQ